MKNVKVKIVVFIVVIVIGLFLRLFAMEKLFIDKDEKLYMEIGEVYKDNIKDGKLKNIIDTTENIEHPPFIKVLFGTSLLAAEKIGIPVSFTKNKLKAMRSVSVILSMIGIVVITLFNPFAGVLMGITSWHVKYSSEAYFDAGAGAFAILAIFSYFMWQNKKGKWLYISAVFMGMAMASKYISITTFAAILPFLIYENRKKVLNILAYIGLMAAIFFLCNPTIWSDTIFRLKTSLFFHAEYSQGDMVKSAGFPFYQQLVWLVEGVSGSKRAFLIKPDIVLLVLGLMGLPLLIKRSKLLGVWYIVNLAALLIYPTKWPQYTMILIPCLALAGGELIKSILKQVENRVKQKTAL